MSLKRILLEFNPNQLQFGDELPQEKLRRNIGLLKKQSRPKTSNDNVSKQDLLKMFDGETDDIKNAINSVMGDENLYEYMVGSDGEHAIDALYGLVGDKGFDWDLIKDLYGDEDADEQELWDFMYDYIDHDFDEALYFIKKDYHDLLFKELAYNIIEGRGEEYSYVLREAIVNSKKVNGEDCLLLWRSIRVDLVARYPLSVNDGVGVYWSYDIDGAVPHGAVSHDDIGMWGEDIILEAYAPISSVDWSITLYKTFWGLNDEMEVELFEAEDVYIDEIIIGENGSKTFVELGMKAQLIFDTYFKKKKEKMDEGGRTKFKNKISHYLRAKNMVSDKFTIIFDDYYKVVT